MFGRGAGERKLQQCKGRRRQAKFSHSFGVVTGAEQANRRRSALGIWCLDLGHLTGLACLVSCCLKVGFSIVAGEDHDDSVPFWCFGNGARCRRRQDTKHSEGHLRSAHEGRSSSCFADLAGFAMLLVFAHVGVEEQAAKQAQASAWLDGSFCEACFCVVREFS